LVTPEILRTLQQQLLVAVLTQTPLPGQSEVLRFPDLAMILERPEKIVSRENLVGEPDPGVPVTFLAADELRELARREGQVPALQFRELEKLDDRIRLALELRVWFGDVEPLPLGAVIATFAETQDAGWRVVDQPAALGY
jgi:hypothetical protein